MARIRQIQNSLITGVIAPTLLGRIDLKKYYNAVEEAENVVIMPHGGMERRSGLKYLATVTTGSRLFSFEFSITQNYMFVMSTANFKVYLPDSGSVLATVAWITALTQTQLDDMDIIQSADTIIITHEDFNPITIQRAGADTSWTLADMVITNIPKFDFDTTKTPHYFNYGAETLYDIEVGEIVYNNDGNDVGGLDEHLYQCVVAVKDVNLAEIDFTGESIQSYTYENDGTAQNSFVLKNETVYNNDGDAINGLDQHYYRAKTNVGNTISPVDLSTVNYANSFQWEDMGVISSGGAWTDLGIRPDVWGDTGGVLTDRGYPRTCTFHQGRLWFGGSKSKPTSVWGSVVNDFYNFDTGKGDVVADDAIFDILDTDQFNAIQNIVSSKTLQVMTAGGEFINTEDVITPTSSGWNRSTSYGSSRIKPVTLDGATYFMDRHRKTVRGFIYSFEDGGYTTPPISILAEHIIEDVQDLDIVRGTRTSVANLLYVINADGTVAVFNTMRKEDIAGWTKWTTNGTFKKVTVTVDTVSFIIERDGVQYLEVLDDNVLLDHAFIGTSSDKVEVDALLLGETINVVADDVNQTTTAAVDEGGTYYAYADATATTLYAGLNYAVLIKTLPVALETQAEGNIINQTKRITQCALNLYNSRGVYVDGLLITSRKFGTPTDAVLTPITGIESTYLLGYNKKTQVSITQKEPDPMTILSVDLEVSY